MCTLLARLDTAIDRSNALGCWPWTKGCSRSGYREVDYPAMRLTQPRRVMMRVNRLVLILKTAVTDCPMQDGEDFVVWVLRANMFYRDKDASHTCDNSRCCRPDHLEWQPHAQNVSDQAARRRRRAA